MTRSEDPAIAGVGASRGEVSMSNTETEKQELEREHERQEAEAFGVDVETLRVFRSYLQARRDRADRYDTHAMLEGALARGADPGAWIDWLVSRIVDGEEDYVDVALNRGWVYEDDFAADGIFGQQQEVE
jgi:hypothetical protein